jgi:hypothetical protein
MLEVGGAFLIGSLLFGTLIVSLVAVPIMLVLAVVGLVLKLVFFILLAPFRIIGWGLGLGLAAVGILVKSVFLAGALAILVLIGLLPLVPLLLIGIAIYLLVRPRRTGGLTPA